MSQIHKVKECAFNQLTRNYKNNYNLLTKKIFKNSKKVNFILTYLLIIKLWFVLKDIKVHQRYKCPNW